ncbi:MAG: hypothetical protein Q8N18_06885 [Opitutaceae bacterium]|nr:hypothetical protein [Opitutaceae bacterium]
MKSKSPAGWLASLFLFVAAGNPVPAQSVAPRANEPAQSAEPAVELSPFVVNDSKTSGYQALSTQAGTRLDTPLKDLGGAISIYTKDFLNDINATSSSDFLIYATGMEAAGPGGTYSAVTDNPNDINFPFAQSYDAQRAPQSMGSRSRGLAPPTFTRNFFPTLIPIDSYNTDRVTVLRGPNAALFGVGSPAGIVDTSTIRADLREDRNNISFRYGNNVSTRATVDFNRVLIKDKLALRLAGLKADERYNQRPAFEKKDRIHGTLTYKPYESTSLRMNFESGRHRANRPFGIVPALNSIMPEWYAAGRPSFDWTFYDDPARNPNAAAQDSSTVLGSNLYLRQASMTSVAFFYNSPTQKTPSFAIRPTTPNTNISTTANAILNTLFHPLLNRDLAPDTPSFSQTRNINEVPSTYWTGANLYPGQLPGVRPAGLKAQGFLDFSAFDWAHRMIDESARQFDNFHSFNVTFEQRAWKNRVGIELALDEQRYDTNIRSHYFGGGEQNLAIRIDTSVTGPDGLPNPNLGRPYVSMVGGGKYNNPATTDIQTARATSYLKYDFKDLGKSWGKWLGSHTLSGVVERYTNVNISSATNLTYDGELGDRISPNFNGRRITSVVYMGPSLIGNNNPLKLEPIRAPLLDLGPAGNVKSFVRAGNATDPGAFGESPIELNQRNNYGEVIREVIKSESATLQSNWLQHHIVTVLGWRRDTSYLGKQDIGSSPNPAAPRDYGKRFWSVDDVNAIFPHTPPRSVSADSKSVSVVAYWPKMLINLPKGTDLNVYYNQSENFTPTGGRVSLWGSSIDPPKGKTKEYGFNFSAFNDKLTVRMNQFETSSVGLEAGSGGLRAVNGYFPAVAVRWLTEANVNPHLQAMRNADLASIDAALKTLPNAPDILKLWSVNVSGTAPNLVATSLSTAQGEDTRDFVAKGQELDLIYSPTSNWRILVNAAHQETKVSNISPYSQRVLAAILPALERLKDRSSGPYPEGWQIGNPLPAGWRTLGEDVDAALTRLPLLAGFRRAKH